MVAYSSKFFVIIFWQMQHILKKQNSNDERDIGYVNSRLSIMKLKMIKFLISIDLYRPFKGGASSTVGLISSPLFLWLGQASRFVFLFFFGHLSPNYNKKISFSQIEHIEIARTLVCMSKIRMSQHGWSWGKSSFSNKVNICNKC